MKIEGIPEGWELVRIGIVKRDEWYIGQYGKPEQAPLNMLPANFPIVRKLEPVLDVSKIRLKKGWVAQDSTARTYWYNHKPQLVINDGGWICDGGMCCWISEAIAIPWREDVPWNERIVEVGE